MTHGLGKVWGGDSHIREMGVLTGNFEKNLKVLLSAHGLKCFLLIF